MNDHELIKLDTEGKVLLCAGHRAQHGEGSSGEGGEGIRARFHVEPLMYCTYHFDLNAGTSHSAPAARDGAEEAPQGDRRKTK